MRIKLPERSIPPLQNLLTILLSLPTPSPEPSILLLLSNVASNRVGLDRAAAPAFNPYSGSFGFPNNEEQADGNCVEQVEHNAEEQYHTLEEQQAEEDDDEQLHVVGEQQAGEKGEGQPHIVEEQQSQEADKEEDVSNSAGQR
jgi:hypothetical protein